MFSFYPGHGFDKFHTKAPLPQTFCLSSPKFWETSDQHLPWSLLARSKGGKLREPGNKVGELFKFMKDLLIQNTSGAVASVNVHEFTSFHIQQVIDNCDKIKTLSDVEDFVDVWRNEDVGMS